MDQRGAQPDALAEPWQHSSKDSDAQADTRAYTETISLLIPDQRRWRRQVSLRDDGATLVVPTKEELRLARKVTLNLSLSNGLRCRLRGEVIGHTPARPGDSLGGCALVTVGGLSHVRVAFIDRFLAGECDERRGRQRLEAQVNVHYRIGDRFYYGVLGDLHEQGVFLVTLRRATVGEHVVVMISDPADGAIVLRGSVVRRMPGIGGGLGLRLERGTDEHRARYRALLHDLRWTGYQRPRELR